MSHWYDDDLEDPIVNGEEEDDPSSEEYLTADETSWL